MGHVAHAGMSLQMHDGTIPGSMVLIPLDDHALPPALPNTRRPARKQNEIAELTQIYKLLSPSYARTLAKC